TDFVENVRCTPGYVVIPFDMLRHSGATGKQPCFLDLLGGGKARFDVMALAARSVESRRGGIERPFLHP
ncbi:MAG: hypothetical protein WA624_15515, partial [Methylocella sp.]